MPLRRPRHAPTLDVDAYDVAHAELTVIREAHESCTETPLDCRAGILWATNATLANLEQPLEPGVLRSLLLDHSAAVNDLIARRSSGRVTGLMVAGTRLQPRMTSRAS
jgi:hypothetical protein